MVKQKRKQVMGQHAVKSGKLLKTSLRGKGPVRRQDLRDRKDVWVRLILNESRFNIFVTVVSMTGHTLWRTSTTLAGVLKRKKSKRGVVKTNLIFNLLMRFWQKAGFSHKMPTTLVVRTSATSHLVRRVVPFFFRPKLFRADASLSAYRKKIPLLDSTRLAALVSLLPQDRVRTFFKRRGPICYLSRYSHGYGVKTKKVRRV